MDCLPSPRSGKRKSSEIDNDYLKKRLVLEEDHPDTETNGSNTRQESVEATDKVAPTDRLNPESNGISPESNDATVLQREKPALMQEIKDKEEKLRKLNLVKLYRAKVNSIHCKSGAKYLE